MSEESPISPISRASTYLSSLPRFHTTATSSTTPWSQNPPFTKEHELCKDLEYTYLGPTKSLPSLEAEKAGCQLLAHGPHQTLPDAPRISLSSPSQITSYCLSDLDTPNLNKLDQKLWWVGPSPVVKTLSEQLTLDRTICVTEDPSMHCIWTENIIFLKPIPAYLCSYAFWEYMLDTTNSSIATEERVRLITTALGFLKTWSQLVQRRSDFNVAVKYHLLPDIRHNDVSFESFTYFVSSFDNIPSSAISPRWRFGELVLGALNFHSAIHLHRWHLNRFEGRYSAYFQNYFPVVLFMFALFSVMLSAMQVILGARQLWDTDNKGLKKTLGLFVWFGTEAIGWSVGFGVVFVVWWVAISGAEATRRHKMQRRMRKEAKRNGEGVGVP